MTTLQKTFKRYEKKYMLTKEQYIAVKKAVASYMKADEFGSYTINNLYFDTDSYEIIRRSIEKPIYKEKLRVRSYGVPEKEDIIYFELKKKFKKEVFKRRISLTVNEFEEYVNNGIKPKQSEQILSEIDYFIKMYKPYPKIFIAYEREALTGIDNENLRVTFDQNIRFRGQNLSLTKGDNGTRILDDDSYLMEIKIPGAMPMWLAKVLTDLEIYSRSFSKYGYCYQNYINKKMA